MGKIIDKEKELWIKMNTKKIMLKKEMPLAEIEKDIKEVEELYPNDILLQEAMLDANSSMVIPNSPNRLGNIQKRSESTRFNELF